MLRPLVVIPARKGSKGIPSKNKKLLGGKPLVTHTIDLALKIFPKEDICVSTDDEDIIELAEKRGLNVPFKRPVELADDTSSAKEVILHAFDYYNTKIKSYDFILMLQPTSPFRKKEFIVDIVKKYNNDIDMVVSVFETKSNPYYILFEEDDEGFLKKVKGGNFVSRQTCPKVYEYNGSIYAINPTSLKNQELGLFKKVVKYEMPSIYSVDLDDAKDWLFAEFLVKENILHLPR